jgi:hypothetical protein
VSEGLLTALKLCFLALLYLFLLRVVRVVVLELRSDRLAVREPAAAPRSGRRPKRGGLTLRVVEPAADAGRSHPLGEEVTLGRAAGCSMVLDDSFVSQVHARVFRQGSDVFVEDLGSTNGTFVDDERITSPTRLRRGGRLRIGNTVMDVTR